ncbi:MAG: hypothetical protein B7Y41_14985 [Hydrogenophilales bacterium 28-61-23]|nr:MAG: hypothetical protein B7Y41_14985 [Hydrogenophilales bacterium 28-61-23]
MSPSFADNLAALPAADHLAGIELIGSDGMRAVIENKPGSQGSLRLYQHLSVKFGKIDASAAAEGLALYAEHTRDARLNPGKHPNIDRLLEIEAGGGGFSARLLPITP